ncbi:hypothetical protein JCM17845_26440 [Iodidimonas gelatinilytica]|uniref:Mannosylglycerate hydrolase MGH1-like glycoside hydrolase domain-containing protein n=1 Tax=Iodidimonas gelatinilytica TaxID=1236966 RepID=A0A5A7N169_9PROT|nr:trehalase family glycosidase [Iodidimonas gelatinilytica]GER02021.1 hypothetical protein JCM17845_26440 [Iodidimonas gelatinilytica]
MTYSTSSQTQTQTLDAAARAILKTNDRGGYTVPNGRVYPFQWNWDSAFVALGFADFDRDRAWVEIETLFEAQWDDGFLPHIVFWKDDSGYFPGASVWDAHKNPATSGITQPPVAASVIRWLWDSGSKSAREAERMAALYPKVLKWHRWFARHRDPEGRGLVVATHPWETGRDNSPEWDYPASGVDISAVGSYERRDTSHLDAQMRPTKLDYDRYLAIVQFGRDHDWDHDVIARTGPFRVADVGMTMILLRANRDLLALAKILGRSKDYAEIEASIEKTRAGIDWLWNDEVEAFCSRDLISGRSSAMITSASFLSFYAGVGTEKQNQSLIAHLDRISSKIDKMLPSLDPDHEAFDAMRYWRGPCWAVVTFLVARGLLDEGQSEWAERLRLDTAALIRDTGFYEAFCPVSGRGTGGDLFSWTAAMWLFWAGKA